jgi:hypothetical protein
MHSLAMIIGLDRLVLRVDPVICTPKGITRAMSVIAPVKNAWPEMRVRISFLDVYNHVKERLLRANLTVPHGGQFHAPLEDRMRVWELLGKPEVCGEPGMECTGCISAVDCEILNVEPNTDTSHQRPACRCLTLKHELLTRRGQCPHNCLYCYWR